MYVYDAVVRAFFDAIAAFLRTMYSDIALKLEAQSLALSFTL
jgi:hypothetical protein